LISHLREHKDDLLFIFACLAGIVAATLAVGGCLYQKPAAPICAKPEYAGSVICAIGEQVGVAPEQMDDMLLDASLLTVATKRAKAQDMKKAIAKVRKWVVDKDVLTMQGIQAYLAEQAKVDPALALLLSRRMPMFANLPGLSDKAFLPIDKQMVISQLDHQDEQFEFL
jgi:hypothetical protein